MSTEKNISELIEEIKRTKKEIFNSNTELDKQKRALKLKEEKLKILIDDSRNEFEVGDKLIFGNRNGEKLIVRIVADSDGRYDAILLTDYSYEIDYMGKYYKFDYVCNYISTLVDAIEKDTGFVFKDRIKQILNEK